MDLQGKFRTNCKFYWSNQFLEFLKSFKKGKSSFDLFLLQSDCFLVMNALNNEFTSRMAEISHEIKEIFFRDKLSKLWGEMQFLLVKAIYRVFKKLQKD